MTTLKPTAVPLAMVRRYVEDDGRQNVVVCRFEDGTWHLQGFESRAAAEIGAKCGRNDGYATLATTRNEIVGRRLALTADEEPQGTTRPAWAKWCSLQWHGRAEYVHLHHPLNPRDPSYQVTVAFEDGFSHLFTGFSWGYNGGGPHGLERVLDEMAVPKDLLNPFTFHGCVQLWRHGDAWCSAPDGAERRLPVRDETCVW